MSDVRVKTPFGWKDFKGTPDGRGVIAEMGVSCPLSPIEIPGITAADAFDANDCFGTVFKIAVPKAGIIQSATYWDMDDEGTQIDFMVFKNPITATTSDAAWAPTDADLLSLVTTLQFATFKDHGTGQTAELVNIGKLYTAMGGYLYVQSQCIATPNIAAGNMPRFQIQIMSLDPSFEVL